MGPIDYSGAFDPASPQQAFTQSLQLGSGIRDMQIKQQQQEQQLAAQQQMQTDLRALGANPSPQAVAALSVRYPQLSEHFKRSYDMLTPDAQQAKLSAAIPVYAAVQSGRPDVAAAKLRDTATAMENSGQKDEAARTRAMADLIEQHPETAKLTTGLLLSSVMGADKFAETFGKLGTETRAGEQAPAELAKKVADADKAASDARSAAIKAKYADSDAILDLQKKGWDIKKVESDIVVAKETARIAAMNAAISREGNELKREELKLKLEEAIDKRDTKVREKAADYESQRTALSDSYGLVREIVENPSLSGAIGLIGGATGTIPGTEARTVAGKIEQLQNSLAAANLDKLKGAMSDKDIMFLKSIATNLDRTQSEASFKKELGRVEDVLVRADKQLRAKFGAPAAAPKPAAAPATPGATGQKNVVVDW